MNPLRRSCDPLLSELDRLVDLNEETFTRLLGEGKSHIQVARNLAKMDEIAGVPKISHVLQNSTPVNLVAEASCFVRLMNATLIGSPTKRISNMVYGVDERSEGPVGSVESFYWQAEIKL